MVVGNCGFGIAPASPPHRDLILRTLERVEGMSLAALQAGIGLLPESRKEQGLITSFPILHNISPFARRAFRPIRLTPLHRPGRY